MLFWRPPVRKVAASGLSVMGAGVRLGYVAEECTFSIIPPPGKVKFYPTKLSVGIEGPSLPQISFNTDPTGVIECTWLPKLPGLYKINIRYNNEEIPGSPFICEVKGGDQILTRQLARIRCRGSALNVGFLNTYNEVIIEEVADVIGGISVAFEGPGRPDIRFRKLQNSLIVMYKSAVPGFYSMNVKFSNMHVPGSPFHLRIC